MKHLSLRLPDDLHAQLAEAADADERSLNSEVIWLMRDGLQRRSCESAPPVPLRKDPDSRPV